MMQEVYTEAEHRMQKSLESFQQDLNKIRTGRAHPSILDSVLVSYYEQPTPLQQVASIVVEDSRTLAITPWEKSMIAVIDKAIRSAQLGLNPVTVGSVVRVPMPPLTEERRRELTKQVRNVAESARIAMRNIRRDANTQTKDLVKTKMITEDEERKGQDKIQKLTDSFVTKIDGAVSDKETDLMKI